MSGVYLKVMWCVGSGLALMGCQTVVQTPAVPSQMMGQLVSAATPVTVFSMAQIDTFGAEKIPYAKLLAHPAQCNVRVQSLHYVTQGVNGEPTNASAALLIPEGSAAVCQQPHALIGYARGTETKRSRTLARAKDSTTQQLAAFYAAQGDVVVAMDYLGFGQSDYPFHPYVHAESEATSMIDALRAARQAMRTVATPSGGLSGDVMLFGHSEGGHAALATQQAIETDSMLSSEFHVVAAGSSAAPAALTPYVQHMIAPQTAGQLGHLALAYAITAYQKVYGDVYRQPSDLFKAPYANRIESLLPSRYGMTSMLALKRVPWHGAADPAANNSALYVDGFAEALAKPERNPALVGPFLAAVKRNDFVQMDWTPKTPTLLCGGSRDPLVLYPYATAPLAQKWAALPNVKVVDIDAQAQPLAAKLWESAQNALLYRLTGIKTEQQYRDFVYHWLLVGQGCMAESRLFFDTAKQRPRTP